MQGAWVKGQQNGRWGAMVTASAGPKRYAVKVKMRWAIVKWLAKRGVSPVQAKISTLAAIAFARWSILDRVPSNVPESESKALGRPFMLFETNFNGDTGDYLESFSFILPSAMNQVWGDAYGVPDVRRTSEWETYVNENKLPIALYYSAYPGVTVRMIRSALALEEMLAEFRPKVQGMSAERFDSELRGLLGRVQLIRNPSTKSKAQDTGFITTLIPIVKDKEVLKGDIQALEDPPAEMPEETHFARWCIIDALTAPPRYKVPNTSYLLFSAWFDGERSKYLRALYQKPGPARADRIWRSCGFVGNDADAFATFLMRHCVKPGAVVAAYNGVTVAQVSDALRVWDGFRRFAIEAQSPGNRAASLRDEWLKDPLLSR